MNLDTHEGAGRKPGLLGAELLVLSLAFLFGADGLPTDRWYYAILRAVICVSAGMFQVFVFLLYLSILVLSAVAAGFGMPLL